MLEHVLDLTKLGHDKLARLLAAHRDEAMGGIGSRLLAETLRGPLHDAHAADAGPIELDHFDIAGGSAAGAVISATVGTELELFATTSNTNEAGIILINTEPQWVINAGVGGSVTWGVVKIQWGISGTGPTFQSSYDATPSTGYGSRSVFAQDFTGHRFKPLHGRTIQSGGGITCRMVVRPIGRPNEVVLWPGADLFAISANACTMIQKMQIWNPPNYGPVHVRALFQGGGDGGQGLGRKQTIRDILGNGRISKLLGSMGGLIDPSNPGGAK